MKALQLMAPFQNPRFEFQQAHNITRHLRRDKERCVLDNANSAISSASNGRATGMWEPFDNAVNNLFWTYIGDYTDELPSAILCQYPR